MKAMKFLLLTAACVTLPAALSAGPGGHGGGAAHHPSTSALGLGAGMGRGSGHDSTMVTGTRITSHGTSTTGHGTDTSTGSAALSTQQSSMGSTNGVGWDHMNGPDHPTGQAFFECEEARPGHASSAPGSAFNEDGNAGTHYAGEQPQNSRNTSSVSQYDTACMHQPQH